MLTLEGYKFDVISDGVCYGYLPKVGESGFLIIHKLYDGKWDFKLPSDLELDEGNHWFQTWDGRKLESFHGLINEKGHITQIG